jgi:hypothetical protein
MEVLKLVVGKTGLCFFECIKNLTSLCICRRIWRFSRSMETETTWVRSSICRSKFKTEMLSVLHFGYHRNITENLNVARVKFILVFLMQLQLTIMDMF